jgi:hypothetical protein
MRQLKVLQRLIAFAFGLAAPCCRVGRLPTRRRASRDWDMSRVLQAFLRPAKTIGSRPRSIVRW